MWPFNISIAHRVWKALKAKIAQAQREYEAGCRAYDRQREAEIKQAKVNCENSKVALADRLVKQIIQ